MTILTLLREAGSVFGTRRVELAAIAIGVAGAGAVYWVGEMLAEMGVGQ